VFAIGWPRLLGAERRATTAAPERFHVPGDAGTVVRRASGPEPATGAVRTSKIWAWTKPPAEQRFRIKRRPTLLEAGPTL